MPAYYNMILYVQRWNGLRFFFFYSDLTHDSANDHPKNNTRRTDRWTVIVVEMMKKHAKPAGHAHSTTFRGMVNNNIFLAEFGYVDKKKNKQQIVLRRSEKKNNVLLLFYWCGWFYCCSKRRNTHITSSYPTSYRLTIIIIANMYTAKERILLSYH